MLNQLAVKQQGKQTNKQKLYVSRDDSKACSKSSENVCFVNFSIPITYELTYVLDSLKPENMVYHRILRYHNYCIHFFKT